MALPVTLTDIRTISKDLRESLQSKDYKLSTRHLTRLITAIRSEANITPEAKFALCEAFESSREIGRALARSNSTTFDLNEPKGEFFYISTTAIPSFPSFKTWVEEIDRIHDQLDSVKERKQYSLSDDDDESVFATAVGIGVFGGIFCAVVANENRPDVRGGELSGPIGFVVGGFVVFCLAFLIMRTIKANNRRDMLDNEASRLSEKLRALRKTGPSI